MTDRYQEGYVNGFRQAQQEGQVECDRLSAALAEAQAAGAKRIKELEERIAELYRAQKSQILSARSFDLDAKLAESFAAGIEAAAKEADRWSQQYALPSNIAHAIRALRPPSKPAAETQWSRESKRIWDEAPSASAPAGAPSEATKEQIVEIIAESLPGPWTDKHLDGAYVAAHKLLALLRGS